MLTALCLIAGVVSGVIGQNFANERGWSRPKGLLVGFAFYLPSALILEMLHFQFGIL